MKGTQKLEERDTYTPVGAPQAHSSVAGRLNNSVRVGAVPSSLKTSSNNSDVAQLQPAGGLKADMLAYVLNKDGSPLMPCKAAKARHLLKQGKATVVKRTPFTIQLLWDCEENTQPITLGIDAGYSHIGYSAVTEKKEVISGDLELRKDMPRSLTERRQYRRVRRSRRWYREPRFDNRKREDDWLTPSIQHKFDSHLKLIARIKEILPITQTIVEVASFDQQRMQDPEISGVEYQQGELQGYEVREYLLEKWERKCAYCGRTGVPLEVEHIVPRSRGGSGRVSNLTISCHECNLEKGSRTAEEFGHPEVQKGAKKPLKAAAFMNVVRQRIVDTLHCGRAYGYITKHDRTGLGLEKSHINDAFVIAGGSEQERSPAIIGRQVRRQNRSLYKANLLKGGRRKRNTIREVRGFRRFDKVEFEGKECFIYGLRSRGYFDLRDIEGNRIGASVSYRKLKLLERSRGIITEVKEGQIPLPREQGGILCPIL